MISKEQAISHLYSSYPQILPETLDVYLDSEEFSKQYTKQTSYPIYGAAIGIVRNGEKTLLTKRSNVAHSGWALPGGRVDEGERFDEAFVREMQEECGVLVQVEDLLSLEKKRYHSPEGQIIELWLATFIATYEDTPIQTEIADSENLQVAEHTQIPDMHPDDYDKIKRLRPNV